ncbi:MAG: DNA polymerase III subunit gamma/tau, partial [Acidobacteriota bacterium]
MAYQVLARKWRPQDFASLVGQEATVTALRNALRDDRIAQAYLFSGIRGVGKTTAARVFAKALNCRRRGEALPDGSIQVDPCNRCDACRAITDGSALDVIEIDAATYSKVEQVRELTESLRYGPADFRYKVVVLDEVHRLSRQAFDALLKIVEEPPAHLVFIFATTELDAVPVTILSRCQQFAFRRVPASRLADYLRTIADAESIEASDAALHRIARAGEGSVRDSVALLDQLATFGNGRLDDDEIARMLGGLDGALFHDVLGAILRGERRVVIDAVRTIDDQGWDPYKVFGQFLRYVRDGLHLAAGGPDALGTVELAPERAEQLAQLTREAGYENVLRVLDLLLRSESTVRHADLGGLALEIVWLRAAELPKLTQIEALLAGGLPATGGPAGPGGGPAGPAGGGPG